MNIKKEVAFRASEVQKELETAIIAVSEEKRELAEKNKVARLKTCNEFAKASEETLALIASKSSEETLGYLMNPSNYKQARRTLQLAKFLSDEKIDVRTTASIQLLNKAISALSSNFNSASFDSIKNRSGLTPSMLKNMIRAKLILGEIKREDGRDFNEVIKGETSFLI